MARKLPTYEPVARSERPDLYSLLGQLVEEHHPELQGAVIQLVWRRGWKPDKDGRVKLGQAGIPSREDRLTHGLDLVDFTEAQKKALLDHELCHFAAVMDEDSGEQKVGADGLREWRMVKHTMEEFHCIVTRHGMWKQDIASFVERALAAGTPEQLTIGDRELLDAVDGGAAN